MGSLQSWNQFRGFSHASALVEQFKQKNKQTTQKSKGISKQLLYPNQSPSQEDLDAAAIGIVSGQEVEAPLEVEGPLEVEAPVLTIDYSAHCNTDCPRMQ